MRRIVARYRQLSVAARASIWFVVCNGLQTAVGFLSLPLFTRLMSPEQFGQIAIYNSWMAILTVFATLNVHSGVFNNGMAAFRDDRRRYLSSMQGLVLVGTAVVFGATVLVQITYGSALDLSVPMICAMFGQILASSVFSLWAAYQRYEFRYHALLWATVAFTVLTTVLSLAAVALTTDDSSRALVRVAAGSCSSLVVSAVLAIRVLRASPNLVSLKYWAYAIKFNLPLIPHYLAFVLLSQIDRIMISDYLGAGEAAMYSVASSMGQVLAVLVNALAASLTPWTYERLTSGQVDGLGKRFWQGTMIVAVASCVIVLLAPELMQIAAPASYSPATPVVALIAMSSIFLFIYSVFANIEFFYAATRFVSIASVIAASAKLVANFLFIPTFGIVGAGATTLACYAIFALAHTLFTRRLWARRLNPALGGALRMGAVWGIAVLGVTVGMFLIALFPHNAVRFGAALLLASICWWKRRDIQGVLARGSTSGG